jgi:plastocyanin
MLLARQIYNIQFLRTHIMLRIILVFCFALVLAACNKAPQPSGQPKPISAIDPTTAATITGTVLFHGAVPALAKIDMSNDPDCGNKPALAENLVVDHGKLANVFVYVKDGLGDRGFATPQTPVTITQQGCRYHPHVLGVMTGQPVRIVNSDTTTHNIHPMGHANHQWNASQLPNADPLTKTFTQPEIMLPIQCNQHPWMHMYLNVVENPFYSVTGPEGRFEIKGLPPGEYTIAAVHEQLGEQTMNITVAPKETKQADFTFSAK